MQMTHSRGGRKYAITVVKNHNYNKFLISGCKMPQSWQGKWFHLGFPEPLDVTDSGISGKGTCVSQKSKNMFLVRER